MKNPFRKQTVVKKNIMLSPTEAAQKGNYIGRVIQKRYYDYYKINHREAVCKIDAIAKRLTHVWANIATAKTFKFYTSHEVSGEECMQEQRAIWVKLNCDEILKKCIPKMVGDGFCLIEPTKKKDSIDYNVFGEYESAPILWTWIADNKISNYKIQYTPHPRGDMKASIANVITMNPSQASLRAISRDITPENIIHVEYGENNHGFGMPLIEGAWDSIIKLAIESNQQMLDKRSIPTLYVDEDDIDAENNKIKALLKMVANSDQDTARVWVRKTNPNTGVVSEYPKFAMESATGSTSEHARQQKQGVSTGDYGNVSSEWTRLTTVTGHTINYFMGNRAGATVGSETDKLADDEQETIDFGLIEPVIRKLLDWLAANGLMILPKEPFVIKYWKDWERIERAAQVKVDLEAQMESQKDDEKDDIVDKKDTKPIDAQDNDPKENISIANELISNELYNCVRNQMSYMMTKVVSHWIDEIGYWDENDRLYMKLLAGQVYSKPAPMGEWSYLDWRQASSKGGYFWNYLSQRDPPWQKDSIPSELLSVSDFVSNKTEISFGSQKIFEKSFKNGENSPSQKVPILDYQLINSIDTEGKVKKLGLSTGWSMGTPTATKIKVMLNSLKSKANKHQLRVNTLNAEAFGNSIKDSHPLMYDIGNGVIVEEYICPESWAKNVGKLVPLGVYHNMYEDIPELPDWQVVGNAEIFGWDDKDGSDFVKYNYDYNKIDSVFKRMDAYDWLSPALRDNGTSDISTAYYCDIDVRWNDKLQRFIRVQINIDLISISFVPRGNCPGEICSIKVVNQNIKGIQVYIDKCIADGEERADCLAKAYKEFKGGEK